MKYILVAVRDNKVNAFMTPVTVTSAPMAMRGFLKETAEGGEFHNLRADVSLWQIGEIDEVSGDFEPALKCLVEAQ